MGDDSSRNRAEDHTCLHRVWTLRVSTLLLHECTLLCLLLCMAVSSAQERDNRAWPSTCEPVSTAEDISITASNLGRGDAVRLCFDGTSERYAPRLQGHVYGTYVVASPIQQVQCRTSRRKGDSCYEFSSLGCCTRIAAEATEALYHSEARSP